MTDEGPSADGRELSLKELSAVYHRLAGEWLLLEIVEGELTAAGARFRLHAHDPDKDRLREFLLENDNWDWQKRYIFVHADPNKPCPTEAGAAVEADREWGSD